MINEPLLAPVTKSRLITLLKNSPHAVMLTGPAGIGKAHIVDWLRQQVNAAPYELIITPEKNKNSISIEAVREIEKFIALKVDSAKQVTRLITIVDAQLLGLEAQNALLKTLEEPPHGTLILLTCSQPESLLPTVRSRLQTIEINPPASSELAAALPVDSESQRSSIMALSGGLPGLAYALALQDNDHPLVQAATTARVLLQASTFSRLAQVDALAKNKAATSDLMQILMLMSHAGLLSGRSPQRWQKVQTAAYDAQRKLQANTQPKLVLSELMLHL